MKTLAAALLLTALLAACTGFPSASRGSTVVPADGARDYPYNPSY